MKLIIDISKEEYISIRKQVLENITNPLKVRIANGIPYEERPQGEWYYSCDKRWECNQCHEVVKEMPTDMRKAKYNFCPNCGADMRGEEE